MGRKLGGLKSIDKHTATFKDNTVLIDYSSDLYDMYQKAIVESLTKQKNADNYLTPYVDKSISGMMNKDRTDLGIKSLEKLENLVKEATEYFKSKSTNDLDFIKYKIDRALFPWQKNVLNSDAKRNTMLCGRRSGKTFVEAGIAVFHCLGGPDIINGYKKTRDAVIIGLSTGWTEEMFWANIKYFINVAGVYPHIDNSNLIVTFENGNTLRLKGNSNKDERSKIRGQDYSLIIIDECQSQKSLGYVIEDLLGPIIKGRDSTIILSGTGSITNKGYWKDVTDGEKAPSFRHFTATMKDNPTIPASALDDVLKENNWTRDNVTYRREYLAENVVDTTRIVYPNFHTYENVAENTIMNYITIGIDYGWNDYNAIVALGKDSKGKIYELETRKFNKADVDNIVKNVQEVWEHTLTKYKVPVSNAICIADTSDQSISAQIQKKGIKIQNAYKVDRIQQIFDLRESLNRGDILVKSTILTDEMEAYVWKYDEETKQVIYETDDDYYHPDALAALRMGWFYLTQKK